MSFILLLVLSMMCMVQNTVAFLPMHTSSAVISNSSPTTRSNVKDSSSSLVVVALSSMDNAMPVPMWPYMGCSGNCAGGPIGLFLALVSCGVGLPLSEDVLLIGLAPRLLERRDRSTVGILLFASKFAYIAAAVAGVALADTLTVCIGRTLRVNADVLSESAPGFLKKMLSAIRKQLLVETKRDGFRLINEIEQRAKRDGSRLKIQIEHKVRLASVNLGDQLLRLASGDNMNNDNHNNKDTKLLSSLKVSWKRLASSNTWARRITCNTRTSLSAWGQTSASLTKIVASRQLSKRHQIRSYDDKDTNPPSPSFFAGIDNRLALGQRWPLCLLSGISADQDYVEYFQGAALAAATFTLPVQLLLGAALQDWARKLCYFAIAGAQLCRYGPVWATVFVAITETVKSEIEAAKKKKEEQ